MVQIYYRNHIWRSYVVVDYVIIVAIIMKGELKGQETARIRKDL